MCTHGVTCLQSCSASAYLCIIVKGIKNLSLVSLGNEGKMKFI